MLGVDIQLETERNKYQLNYGLKNQEQDRRRQRQQKYTNSTAEHPFPGCF